MGPTLQVHARTLEYDRTVNVRDEAHALLDRLPDDRVEAALEAVRGDETSVSAILARHGEQRLDSQDFERHLGSLPLDEEG